MQLCSCYFESTLPTEQCPWGEGGQEHSETERLSAGSHVLKKVRNADTLAEGKQEFFYNHRNEVRNLPALSQGDAVGIRLDEQKAWTNQGTIQGSFSTPRSYVVETTEGKLIRRNSRHLQKEHTPSVTRECTEEPECRDLMDFDGISAHAQGQDTPPWHKMHLHRCMLILQMPSHQGMYSSHSQPQ